MNAALLYFSIACVAYGVGCMAGRAWEDRRRIAAATLPLLLAAVLVASDPHLPGSHSA